MKTKYLLIGAIILFALLAIGGGVYAFMSGQNNGGATQPGATSSGVPVSIKIFRVQNGSFVMQGDNLSRVEVWAIRAGQPALLGNATQSGGGQNGTGQTWTLPVPPTARGASGVYAKGYDSGSNAVRIDLNPADLKNL